MTVNIKQGVKLDRCPRCKSPLMSDTDRHGEHQFCWACGFYNDLTDTIGYCENHTMAQDDVKQMSRLDNVSWGGYAQELSNMEAV